MEIKKFVPGIKISQMYYKEIIDPILKSYKSDLSYTAALIGPGSEVLGFDTEMSRDHDWYR